MRAVFAVPAVLLLSGAWVSRVKAQDIYKDSPQQRAMFGKMALPQTAPATPEPVKPAYPTPPDIKPGAEPDGPAVPEAPATDSTLQVSQNTADRYRTAQTTIIPIDNFTTTTPAAPGCPAPGKGKLHTVDLYWDSGGSSASRLRGSGTYCFILHDANPLYQWSFNVTVTAATGNPFDMLNDGIQTLTKLVTGASSPEAKPTTQPSGRNVRPAVCPVSLAGVTQTATFLKQALTALAPTKDSSTGKYSYIPFGATRSSWATATTAFNEFERSVKELVASLGSQRWNQDGCDAVFDRAESIILADFPTLRGQYLQLQSSLNQPAVVCHERDLDETAPARLTVSATYAGQQTSAPAETFDFEPSFGILSSSAGFLLTRLAARSYSSATAPDPTDATKTQNVLNVDYGRGIRPALAVLLTGNVPQVNTRNFGLGVSAGPVFDIANGKADTSRFGVFGGLSVRLTPWIYLTAGPHFGEFADFPPGFTHSGQAIAANTGTPTATKRYTARFAFSVTFKLKDLGAPTSGGQVQPAAPAAGQPPGGKPAGQ